MNFFFYSFHPLNSQEYFISDGINEPFPAHEDFPRKPLKINRKPTFFLPRNNMVIKPFLQNFAQWPLWSSKVIEILEKELSFENFQKIAVSIKAKEQKFNNHFLFLNLNIRKGLVDISNSNFLWYPDEEGERINFATVKKIALNPNALSINDHIIEFAEMPGWLLFSKEFCELIFKKFSAEELKNVKFVDINQPAQFLGMTN